MVASVFISLAIVCAALADDDIRDVEDKRPKLRFFNGDFENYTELPFDDAKEIFSSDFFDTDRMTTIFCHGFTGNPNGPAVVALTKAYLEQGESNVVLLNWDQLAANIYNVHSSSYLHWAIPNAAKVAAQFADVLLTMSELGLDLNKTHLIGHSLGGQIVGMTGNKMTQMGVQLPWITGLDPAGILFDSRRPSERLNPNSAVFVDVIHTDPNKYGSRRSLGTVDFWPNFRNGGPVVQPGCDNRPHPRFSPGDLCNHHRAWELLIDSLKYPGTLIGSYAKNFRTWKNYSKEQRTEVVLELGKYSENPVPGDYFLMAADSSPYGLGEDGL